MRERTFRSLRTDFLEPRMMLSADAFAAAPTEAQESAAAYVAAPGNANQDVVSDQGHALDAQGASETHKGLATFRRVTARYHRVEAAIEDGFVQVQEDCLDEDPSTPAKTGIPYVNPDRIADGTINPEEPEVLFYEPQKNGKLRLVGGEFAVPIDVWDADHDEPPSLFGQEFQREEDAGLYGLHVWWGHNPAGAFALDNPNVTCEF